jgi:hypothetical protein
MPQSRCADGGRLSHEQGQTSMIVHIAASPTHPKAPTELIRNVRYIEKKAAVDVYFGECSGKRSRGAVVARGIARCMTGSICL